MKLTKDEVQRQINNSPVIPNQIWIHRKKRTLYKVINVTYHVKHKTIEVSYVDEEGFPCFTREINDFLQKFSLTTLKQQIDK